LARPLCWETAPTKQAFVPAPLFGFAKPAAPCSRKSPETFAPLREVLSQAVIRRSGDLWQSPPLGQVGFLRASHLPLSSNPLPAELLHKDTSLVDAIRALKENSYRRTPHPRRSPAFMGNFRPQRPRSNCRSHRRPSDGSARGYHPFQAKRLSRGESSLCGPSTIRRWWRSLPCLIMASRGCRLSKAKDNPRPVGYLRREKNPRPFD